MAKRIPLVLPQDLNGQILPRFLDAFELVRWKTGGEPKYYGYLHPEGHFCITKHVTAGVGEEMDEHLTFYRGAVSETLADVWDSVATLDYAEYSEVY